MGKGKRYRIGIAGAGTIAETRLLPAMAAIKEFEAACVYDSNSERLEYISKAYSIKAVSALEELYSNGLDAVYIATPNNYHMQLAVQALKHGAAVLLEKPCAGKLEDAMALLKAVHESDRPLLVAYMSKWNRNNQLAQKLLNEGCIGELCTFTASFGWYNQNGEAWRLFRNQSGPGALADIGIYAISTALDFIGEMPVSCTARAYPAGDREFGDKYLSGRVDFRGGRWMQIAVSFLSASCGYTMVGTRGAIHVEGSWAQSGEGEVVICTGNHVEKVIAENVNPYEEELRCFRKCLDGETVPSFMGIERAVEDIKVMDALDRSAAQMGKEIAIK